MPPAFNANMFCGACGRRNPATAHSDNNTHANSGGEEAYCCCKCATCLQGPSQGGQGGSAFVKCGLCKKAAHMPSGPQEADGCTQLVYNFAAELYNKHVAAVSILEAGTGDDPDLELPDFPKVARADEYLLSALPGRCPGHSTILCTACCQQLCTTIRAASGDMSRHLLQLVLDPGSLLYSEVEPIRFSGYDLNCIQQPFGSIFDDGYDAFRTVQVPDNGLCLANAFVESVQSVWPGADQTSADSGDSTVPSGNVNLADLSVGKVIDKVRERIANFQAAAADNEARLLHIGLMQKGIILQGELENAQMSGVLVMQCFSSKCTHAPPSPSPFTRVHTCVGMQLQVPGSFGQYYS